jgi:hypothetical protein
MLRIQLLGLALVAAFALSAVVASSAFAAHEWLIGGNPILTPVKVHSLGLLLLADTKATGGEVKIHCHGYDTGTVGPGPHDLIEKITTTLLGSNERIHCQFDKKGACRENLAEDLLLALPLHLPWLTLIKLINGNVRDLIEKDGSGGNPGWKVVCINILGGVSVDECTNEVNSVGLANVAAGVEAKFDGETLKANCSIGGANSGAVEGFDLIESPAGGAANKLSFQ